MRELVTLQRQYQAQAQALWQGVVAECTAVTSANQVRQVALRFGRQPYATQAVDAELQQLRRAAARQLEEMTRKSQAAAEELQRCVADV